jgi:4-aminobutyrate aminotransferase-like enzyme
MPSRDPAAAAAPPPVLSNRAGPDGAEVAGAAGSWFRLADGRPVIDASNMAAPLGHCHPDLVAAVRGASGSPAPDEGWIWRGRQRAADDLLEHAFGAEDDWVGAVRFFASASEASDQALSLARALTGRDPLVTREHAGPGMVGLRQVPAPRCRVTAPCGPGGRCRCLPGDLPARLAGAAAVIVDYSQGGIYPAPAYQDQLAEAARAAGAFWIADEVVTGLGRQGRWMAFQRGRSRPDIVTLGKGLAGGIAPAAAVVLSREVADGLTYQLWQSYSTFRGHPLTVAAISATVRRIARDGLVDRADALDAEFRPRLTQIAAAHPSVCRVDGLGLHWTIELRGADGRGRSDGRGRPVGPVGPTPAERVVEAALDAGVLIAAAREEASVFIAPPLNVADSEVDLIVRALDRALSVTDAALARDQDP